MFGVLFYNNVALFELSVKQKRRRKREREKERERWKEKNWTTHPQWLVGREKERKREREGREGGLVVSQEGGCCSDYKKKRGKKAAKNLRGKNGIGVDGLFVLLLPGNCRRHLFSYSENWF